jgi:hypothetical protein
MLRRSSSVTQARDAASSVPATFFFPPAFAIEGTPFFVSAAPFFEWLYDL